MDAYIQCIASLNGRYRNAMEMPFQGRQFHYVRKFFFRMICKAMKIRKIDDCFLSGWMAVALSFVGLVHPFSAGLSVVLGIRHCVGNCITMRGMEDFIPHHTTSFGKWLKSKMYIFQETSVKA